jgi:predicted RNA-binding protein (virulence factor B family)
VNLGEYALLRVVGVEPIGAFLDWGQPKDLFLPFAERTRIVRYNEEIIVFAYLDKLGRPTASMRLERNKLRTNDGLTQGQKVDLIIADQTDLGYKAVVNQKTLGMLYHNEVFQSLSYGQKVDGHITKIRDDGRLDLILQSAGHKAAVDDIAPKILALLEKNGGFFDINDKTHANRIYELFGVSKNKYKIALGGLYKSRQITISDDGIRLTKKVGPTAD